MGTLCTGAAIYPCSKPRSHSGIHCLTSSSSTIAHVTDLPHRFFYGIRRERERERGGAHPFTKNVSEDLTQNIEAHIVVQIDAPFDERRSSPNPFLLSFILLWQLLCIHTVRGEGFKCGRLLQLSHRRFGRVDR